MSRRSTGSRGFTLVELAIVLFIVGLLLAGLLTPLATRMEQEERRRTEAMLEEIREALYGFAVTWRRLPCPDIDGDGEEDPPDGPCTAAEGTLPWVTLGVSELDAWGRRFTYRVDTAFAAPSPPTGASFALDSTGNITVRDAAGAGGNPVASNIPAIVVSHGRNGAGGAVSSHELENTNGDVNFVMKSFSRDPVEEFDDLLIWISPNILKNRMIMAGRLP